MKYVTLFFVFLFLGLAVWMNIDSPSWAEKLLAPIAEEKKSSKPMSEPVSKAVSVPVSFSVPKADSGWTNLIYFTGVGCPHCASSDPVVLKNRPRKGDVMIFEYEIYRDSVNGQFLMDYNKLYGASLAVPQIIAGPEKADIVSGNAPILKGLDTLISLHKNNDILLGDTHVSFGELSLVKLPYKPKIWFKDRVAIRKDSASLQSDSIKDFLLKGIVPEDCEKEEKAIVPLSGSKVKFKEACLFDGWVLMHD